MRYLQTQTAFQKASPVWHRAVKDGRGGYAPLCGARVAHEPVVLDRLPPAGRLCLSCARVASNRWSILVRLYRVRKGAIVWL